MQRFVFLLLLGVCACASAPSSDHLSSTPGPRRQVLAPSPSPLPFFSPAVRAGELVFLSGQIGIKPGTRDLAPGGIQGETRQVLDNIRTLLEQIGLSMSDVVKCTVFLADIADFAAMNEVYQEFFPSEPPARSTLAAGGLVRGARVEIECISVAPQ